MVLDDGREGIFRNVNQAACTEMSVLIHAVGVVPDHVHLAVSIPPKWAVADVVRRIKGSSSRALKEADGQTGSAWPGWQSEYGVLTFGERSLADVTAYVHNQRTHHSSGTLLEPFEVIDRRDVDA
jgi:REP element-mobilizing transposase RayT